MARVLISSLGVGRPGRNNEPLRKYSETEYKFPGEDRPYKTPFVAAALIERLQIDRLYLIGTSKSMWEEVYVYFMQRAGKPVDEHYWAEIGTVIQSFKPWNKPLSESDLLPVSQAIDNYLRQINKGAVGGSRCLVIDYGLNDEELWRIFDAFMQIANELSPNDVVFLDITHSFRSIPLFVYLMLDLMKTLHSDNEFKLGGLYYGMQDVIGDLGYAPVVDLTPLYNITEWARGAYNFTNFGNGYLLAELIQDEKIAEKIRNISNSVDINYIDDFKREVDSLDGLLRAKLSSSDPVVKYMEPYLRAFTDRFKGISSTGELQFALAKWYFNNKRFAQGYICLAEAIISRILEMYRSRDMSLEWTNDNRDKVKQLIRNKMANRSEYAIIYEVYEDIRIKRNTIAHAGFSTKQNFADDIEKAAYYLHTVEKCVFKNPALKKLPDLFPFATLT